MKLSVVILNYNVRYFLELCIKSVIAATSKLDAEILVIDNNSKDDSRQMVADLFPAVKWIQNTTNVGFSKANNQAVTHARGEYICILNPDTVVSEDTFIKLLNFSETKENLGIVGCKLIDGTGKYLPESKRNIPYVSAAIKKMFGASEAYYASHLLPDDIGRADIFVGAFMFLRREVYMQVKGFDEDYFMYGEDVDISYKILKAGFDNYYFGNTTVIHFKGESTLKDKKYARRFYGAMQIFYRKHFKKNMVFDALVWLGLKAAFLFRQAPKTHSKQVKQYFFIGTHGIAALENVLVNDLKPLKLTENIPLFSEVILDANTLSYKQIITYLSQFENDNKVSFKILPDNSNFIIGSDDSINQGQVILFKKSFKNS
ncbi:MAG: glycosyltransferase family 2 protein [Flavobacteriaceae bacterium]|nr:glycosyltransferase family 2 protein [Flavobacteriaceae bacterium]